MTTTSIHAMALDGIVNVNSLFTVATFLGLALNPASTFLNPTSACTATTAIAKHLVAFHVYAFSSFLFSSLIAFALKQAAIRTTNIDDGIILVKTHVDVRALRAGILASAAGSVSGCVFLTLALVDLVQIKLGVLSCWSWYTLAALAPLVTLVPSALVTYVCLVLHAFAR